MSGKGEQSGPFPVSTNDPPARIPQISDTERSEDVQHIFSIMAGVGAASNIAANHALKTLAQHPPLAQPFFIFNRHLLTDSTVPVRLRQLAILRIAWLRSAVYMWSSHLRISLSRGLDRADFAAVKQGPDSPRWNSVERAVLSAVDQLCDKSDVDDALWSTLIESLDHRQMLDFLFTVGTYAGLAMVFKAIRIEREPELRALAEIHGWPGDGRV